GSSAEADERAVAGDNGHTVAKPFPQFPPVLATKPAGFCRMPGRLEPALNSPLPTGFSSILPAFMFVSPRCRCGSAPETAGWFPLDLGGPTHVKLVPEIQGCGP